MTSTLTSRALQRIAIILSAATAAVVLAGLLATPAGAQVAKRTNPAQPVRVALYGDSLADEARDQFVTTITGTGTSAGPAEVRTGTYGGTAICDWLDQMRRDAAEWKPKAVVVEFSGNALTPCMKAHDGTGLSGDAYFAKYRQDAAEVVRIFSAVGARVYFAGSPISKGAQATGDFNGGKLNAIYQATAGARYIDAGAAVLNGRGRYTDTLPCLASEPCTGPAGTNVVRAPDGAHFCPGNETATSGVTETCAVWSSGAFRYANAMAAPVVRDLGLRAR